MTDDKTQRILQDIVRRLERSFVQYIRDAFPWTTADEQKLLKEVQQLNQEERQMIAAYSKFLARCRIRMPHLGPYPVSFTTLNYVSLEHLLPIMAEHEQQSIAALERDVTQLSDDAEAQEQVRKILDMKRRHLQMFEALAAAHPETASTLR
jgi:hypothetical protein